MCSKEDGWKDCDTSRPERDPGFKTDLEHARQKAVANTWLTLGGVSLVRSAASAGLAVIRGGGDWAALSGMLRAAASGKGNFGVGGATTEQAQAAGKAWVGEGATLASDGKTLVSADQLRQYRPPSFKPDLGRVQANLEWRLRTSGQWHGNAHIDITTP